MRFKGSRIDQVDKSLRETGVKQPCPAATLLVKVKFEQLMELLACPIK